MAKSTLVSRMEYHLWEEKLGLSEVVMCSDDETVSYTAMLTSDQPLPSDVEYYYESNAEGKEYPVFYHCYSDLSDAEKQSFIELLQLGRLERIHRWILFFGILAMISVFGGLLAMIVFSSPGRF